MSLLQEKIELDIQEGELAAKQALRGLPPLVRWLVILLAVAIIPTYFIAKSVSFGIWQKRLAQGAIAAKPSFTNPTALQTSKVNVTSLGQNRYAAAVQVTNLNLDLSLENVPFEADFFNSQNQQVYSYRDNLFLLPNQSKFLIIPTFTAADTISSTNLVLPPKLPWQKRLSVPTVNLSTSLPTVLYQNSPQAFVVSGYFTNNSPYALAKVHLTFVVYDTASRIVAVSSRDELTVAPYEHRAYKQLWPNSAVANLGRVDVTAETDTLNPANLSVPDSTGSSSDLSRPTSGQ